MTSPTGSASSSSPTGSASRSAESWKPTASGTSWRSTGSPSSSTEAGSSAPNPGVTFTDPGDKGGTVGEADVLLLFADGSLVPVEVKRRLAGADDRTAQLMDTLADALAAPWDALVVTEPAREIPALAAVERRLPDRPRVILTDDQLHAEHVIWAMGGNPFGWDPRTAEQDRDRERSFSKWLSANDPDVPWDRIADTLLDRTLGAPRDTAEDAAGPD